MSAKKQHSPDLSLQSKDPPWKPQQSGKEGDMQRLELLKRQKESERREREKALWREASRIPTSAEIPGQPLPTDGDSPLPAKPLTGLFAKLRLGKFLE